MATPSPALFELLSKVIGGEASTDELLRQVREHQRRGDAGTDSDGDAATTTFSANDFHGPSDEVAKISGATIDLGRQKRCGFGEVIFGEGKSAELVAEIIKQQLDAGQSAMVTRIESNAAFRVRQAFEHACHNPVARTLRVSSEPIAPTYPISFAEAGETLHAAIVTAGSTDLPVAEEAAETLAWMGVPCQRFEDIGVAGPQRLAAAVPQLRQASAVVVIAGMEGALPAAVAGYLPTPVFAVPTSVGYGASLGGLTPLMGMLSSCAANVAVVNIDAGFKGGFLAGMLVRQLQQLRDSQVQTQTPATADTP